jgi:hypothetical protein
MCDYSLTNVKSRAAKVGDKLTTKNFGAGTRGFAAPEDATTAVCLLPGTEIAFAEEVKIAVPGMFDEGVRKTEFRTAIFRQVDKELPHRHHDAIEFPDGAMVLLTHLTEGQEATVLQLPAQPTNAAEAEAQTRAAYAG